ncbi:glycosyltransferase [Rhodobacter ferrooxidans]|uniref:glycosyltransferase n=1 Tax=Rhodobacter ferrooxidans TaxID=371731 RepID=UPI0018DDAED5|nr:glycosyltransferase [Rhodobacter sp. SW2]
MAAVFRNQIIGLVRFSYPSNGGFTKTVADPAALEAQLYDPDRLQRRFDLFEKLTLPSLLAQTDDGFQTVFLTGRNLPEPAMKRLRDVVAPLKGAKVVAMAAFKHYPAMQRAFAGLRNDSASHFTSFRLDDDDALDRGFVTRLRKITRALVTARGSDRPLAVGFNRGLFLEKKAEGNTLYEVTEKLPLGIGLGLCVPAGSDENIFRRNHRHLPQYYSTYTDADTPAFIRSVHADNDSQPNASGLIAHPSDDELRAMLKRHFPFTLEQLRGF